MTKVTRIFGPPGTGKTTTLLGIVEAKIEAGIPPERIAYVSFSTKAAHEAVERAQKRFGMGKDRFPYFRTLHSLGFRSLGMRTDEKLEYKDYEGIADLLGIGITRYRDEEDSIFGSEQGDQCMALHSLARNRMIEPEQQWREAEAKIKLNYAILEQWITTVDEYKRKRGMYDFTDMLEHYSGALPVDIFIIDEAQDLSKLQWEVVRKASANAGEIYVAGDDDQCIYNFSGADLRSFLDYPVDEDIILPKSYRVPSKILAFSNEILSNIGTRRQKDWHPKEEPGELIRCQLEELDIQNGNWLLLTRNTGHLKIYEDHLQELGLLYRKTRGKNLLSIDPEDASLIQNWEKLRKGETITSSMANSIVTKIDPRIKRISGSAISMERMPFSEEIKIKPWYDVFAKGMKPRYVEYIRACLRHGQKLNDQPRITISTIHKVKGGECDNVALLPDMAYATYREASGDDEHRVWYVGATRAKNRLFLLEPKTDMFYKF